MSNFEIKLQKFEKGDVFQLQGVIDEFADFSTIIPKADESVIVDMGGVKRINSLGIRNWVEFLNTLTQHELFYLNCPVFIVEQMIMLPEFRGHGKVLTLLLPFFCNDCDESIHTKFHVNDIHKPDFFSTIDKNCKCPKCALYLEFDDDVDIYEKYLKLL